MTINGTNHNDNLTGTAGADIFDLSQGGEDRAKGLGGNDTFRMGGAMDAGDRIDGGAGNDTLALDGVYTGFQLVFNTTSIVSIETITMAAGNTYYMDTVDANVAAGATLTLDASALGANNSFALNGGDETDGTFHVIGGAGDDAIQGGLLNDTIDLSRGGADNAFGNTGDDTFLMGAALDATDTITGYDGTDTVVLDGDYSQGLVLAVDTIFSVEAMLFTKGHDYDITAHDAMVSAGDTFAVKAGTLGAADSLTFDGSGESNGAYAVTAGAGDDTIRTGAGDDTIRPGGGHDFVSAGDGADTIDMGSHFDAQDRLNGGAGLSDILLLDGDYTGARALTLTRTMFADIERAILAAGHSYDISMTRDVVPPFTNVSIDAGTLTASDSLTLEAAAYGSFSVVCGAGNDTITVDPLSGAIVDLSRGGNDTVHASANSQVFMGASLTPADRLVGGIVDLAGDYSGTHKLVMAAATAHDIGTLSLGGDFNYNITMNDGNLSAGGTMIVSTFYLGPAQHIVFDGSAETDGSFNVADSLGNDLLKGGAKDDNLEAAAGHDTVYGGGGNDVILGLDGIDNKDTIDGGGGNDTLILAGDYSLTFAGSTLKSVENIVLFDDHIYFLATRDANVAAHATLTIDGSKLVTAGSGVAVDGSAEKDGAFHLIGGAFTDEFTGGKGNDVLEGGGAADALVGGGGSDHFVYKAAADSTGGGFDFVYDFKTSNDRFDMPFAVTKVNAPISGGTLNGATFDADMAAAVDAAHLGKHHAVVFTPSAGDYAGFAFVIVEGNNVAGYQAGQDYVMNVALTGALVAGDFI